MFYIAYGVYRINNSFKETTKMISAYYDIWKKMSEEYFNEVI